VESNGRMLRGPTRCVLVVATARQPVRGPDSMVSLCQVKDGVAAALRLRLRLRIPHGGGLLGVVQSTFVGFPIDAKSRCRFRRLRERVGGCRVRWGSVGVCGPCRYSNLTEQIYLVELRCTACVDVPIRPTCLVCVESFSARVDAQSKEGSNLFARINFLRNDILYNFFCCKYPKTC
jgi:hypothetical protein